MPLPFSRLFCYLPGMGFFVTDYIGEQANLPPKNRVGVFSTFSETGARFFVTQALEAHRENEPIPTTTASGMRFYGFRFYSPKMGRWLSRDPINEDGFRRAFRLGSSRIDEWMFVKNNPINKWDYLGLDAAGALECCKAKFKKKEAVCQEGCDLRKPTRPSSYGEAICYKGYDCKCNWSDRYSPPPMPGSAVAACEDAHEQYHLDTQTDTCPSCNSSAPKLILPVTAPYDECGAYAKQKACLDKVPVYLRDASWDAMNAHVEKRKSEEGCP